MLLDALKFLTEIISKAEAPKRLDIADPCKAFFAVGGEIEQHELPPPPRDHAPRSLADLIALANRFAARRHEDGPDDPGMAVWYDERQVVLVYDDDGHRVDRARLALEVSDVFARLVELRNARTWYEPKPFIRLLRIELAGTLPPEALLERVRRLKIENGQVVSTRIGRADESLGREITARVSGEGEIPEEVTLAAPVYKTAGETERLPVRCAVEVDPARGMLQLLPLPDEIERVQHLAVASLAERLQEGLDKAVPCYYGAP